MGKKTSRSTDNNGKTKNSGFDSKIAGAMIMGVSFVGICCMLYDKLVDSGSPSNITVSRIVLGLFMILGGLAHFDSKKLNFYIALMPPIFAFKKELIYFTGVTEALGGILMLFEFTMHLGAVITIMNLIAVFPANIYCAFSKTCRDKTGIPLIGSWIRLPFQFVFIGMAMLVLNKQENSSFLAL